LWRRSLHLKALAQGETTSAIVGQVRDTTNAVVPDATVTIANPETGLRRSAKTDDARSRSRSSTAFRSVLIGCSETSAAGLSSWQHEVRDSLSFMVKVEAQGFEPHQNNNVVSSLGQKQTVDFILRVARSNETVEVNSEAPLINPEDANTSTTLKLPSGLVEG
jgi:hypothetical protein